MKLRFWTVWLLAGAFFFFPAVLFAFQPLFDTWISYPVGLSPNSVLAVDVDKDGDLDLVVTDSKGIGGGGLTILLNNGNGTFTFDTTYAGIALPSAVMAADLDRDGDLELIPLLKGSANFSVFDNLHNPPQSTDAFRFAFLCQTAADPVAAVSLDLDRDGDSDVVAVASTSQPPLIQTFINEAGKFPNAPDNEYRTRAGPTSLAAFDFDQDGDQDVVVTDSISDSISVFINKGDGTFYDTPPKARLDFRLPGTTPPLGIAPRSVVAADFDRDGDGDLAVLGVKIGRVIIFRNVPFNPPRPDTVAFTLQATSFPVDSFATALVAADLDGDGDKDLLVSDWLGSTVSVLINTTTFPPPPNTNITFAPRVDYLVKSGPLSVAAADLDGDGDVDVITPNDKANAVTVMPNKGNGTLLSGTALPTDLKPVRVVAADLDGDGDRDLAVANNNGQNISLFRNDSSFGFVPFAPFPLGIGGGAPNAVVACDLDGDGKQDLVVSNQSFRKVTVFINTGNATFPSRVDYPVGANSPISTSITCADLDGDGDNDLAVANSAPLTADNVVSVLKNNGDGTFTPRINYPAALLIRNPTSIVAADLDRDNDLDLVLTNQGFTGDIGTVSVLFNSGSGTFSLPFEYSVGFLPSQVVVSDLDTNGYLDLAVTNKGAPLSPDNTVSILLNNGDGTFNLLSPNIPVGGSPASLFAGDFDQDGTPDLAVANSSPTSNTVSFLKGNGNGTFAPQVEYGAGGRIPNSLVGADLDGDGDLDLAVTSETDNRVVVLKNLSIPLSSVPGDINQDGFFALSDVVAEINCVFLGEGSPGERGRADVNCNGILTAQDLVILINGYYLVSPLPICP